MSAIVIEQSLDEAKLAFEVHQNADIDRIRLARAKVASQAIDVDPLARIGVAFTFKSKAISANPNLLRLEIAFRMSGVQEDAKAEAVVQVDCAYEVDYKLREGFEITSEHVKAFKDGNAIFNVWPYFREYLQNNLERMGMPPLTAPFLRLEPKRRERKRQKA